ncbi:MAG: hypothetical protein IKG58_02195 [Bacilli bacterium]|nr:hypothetical protein [Bacilli bacterium]
MIDYLICSIFLVLFISFIYLFGTALQKKETVLYRFIIGYIVYSFFVAVAGVITQVLKINYFIFFLYMILLILGILTFSIYKIKKDKIKVFPDGKLEVLKNYWFIIVIVGVLTVTSLGIIEYLWLGNHQDDGYYVNRVATYATKGNIYNQTVATGLPDKSIDTYALNTWEIESSVFVRILHVSPTIYLKFALATFNYLLVCVLLVLFAERLFGNKRKRKRYYQLLPLVLLVLGLETTGLNRYIIFLQDSWQFNAAMFYGSCLVRVAGLLFLMIHFIGEQKLSWRLILLEFLTSVVLISKSTIAIPIIGISILSYLIVFLLYRCKKKIRLLVIPLIVFIIIASIALKNIAVLDNTIISQILLNKKSILIYISIVTVLCGFIYRNKEVNIINTFLILVALFMVLNPINDITENLSMYAFVEARMLACIVQTIMICAFIYASVFLFNIIKKDIILKIGYLLVILLLFFGIYLSYTGKYKGTLFRYKILYKNPYLLPNGTINLANKLEDLYKKDKKTLNVIAPEGMVPDEKYIHCVAVLLRSYAPDINVITAIGRYGVKKGNDFSKYTTDDTKKYYDYLTDENNTDYINEFNKVLKEFPINCIVTSKKLKNPNNINYKYYDKACDNDKRYCYYIYTKERA